MHNRRSLNRQISVSGQFGPDDLGEVSRAGFASVVDVRPPAEPGEGLSPDQERQRLAELGVEYAHIPIPQQWVDAQSLEALGDALDQLRTPILVHCESGARAAVLTMIAMGRRNGWSADETLERARGLGIACESRTLEDAARHYLDTQDPRDAGYCSVG
jgi:uncharacterized protein (TIGR01244 family)